MHYIDNWYSLLYRILISDIDPEIAKEAITVELCAGIVDKSGKSLEQIAREEVEEECGFRTKSIECIQTFRSSIGTGGQNMTLFYAEVSEEDRVSAGGGLPQEGELIEVVELPLDQIKQFLGQSCVNSPSFTLYGLQWFLANKNSK